MLYKWSPSLLSYLNHSAIFTRECDFSYIWADFHLKNENIHWMIVSYVMLVWFPSRIVYIFSQFFLIFQGEKETVVFKVDKYGNKDIHIPCLRKYRQSEYRKLLLYSQCYYTQPFQHAHVPNVPLILFATVFSEAWYMYHWIAFLILPVMYKFYTGKVKNQYFIIPIVAADQMIKQLWAERFPLVSQERGIFIAGQKCFKLSVHWQLCKPCNCSYLLHT